MTSTHLVNELKYTDCSWSQKRNSAKRHLLPWYVQQLQLVQSGYYWQVFKNTLISYHMYCNVLHKMSYS